MVSLLIFTFEMEICGWPWTSKDRDPVFEEISLAEGPVSIWFGELLHVQVLSGGDSAAHEEQVVPRERDWIDHDQNTIDKHSEGDFPSAEGGTKRDVLPSTIH